MLGYHFIAKDTLLLILNILFTYYCSISMKRMTVYCNNIETLLNEMGVENSTPVSWRLFIDSSE